MCRDRLVKVSPALQECCGTHMNHVAQTALALGIRSGSKARLILNQRNAGLIMVASWRVRGKVSFFDVGFLREAGAFFWERQNHQTPAH